MQHSSQAEREQIVLYFSSRQYLVAETLARKLIKAYPNDFFGWKSLGTILVQCDRTSDGIVALENAISIYPKDHECFNALGNAFRSQGLLDKSAAMYTEAINLNPNYCVGHNNLGAVLLDLGEPNKAINHFKIALEINAAYPNALNNIGNALYRLGKLHEAIKYYRLAIDINPDFAEAHNNIGTALKGLLQAKDSLPHFQKALQINPRYSLAYSNMANSLQSLGRFKESLEAYQKAIEINPHLAEAYNNMGNALKEIGLTDESLISFRKALEIKPDYHDARSNMIFVLNSAENSSKHQPLDEARRYGGIVSGIASKYSTWQCKVSTDRLRVGIVSGDLCNHPVGYFLESVLKELNNSQIELFAYTNDGRNDELTKRIQKNFSHWNSIAGLNDNSASRLIHDDGINILIDLSGHTANNRLPLFAFKPAPIQASWLGYFATTGVPEIDYILADKISIPERNEINFTEKVWHLPDTRLCFSKPTENIPITRLPALKNNYITFGNFQGLSRLRDPVLSLWGRILAGLPSSQLRIQCKQLSDPMVSERFIERLKIYGISSARVCFHAAVPRFKYFEAHSEVDILLDSFPYPGGTTTCEALWMGVPTLTLAGNNMLSRQGNSIMTAAGLVNWVAQSEDEYVHKAISYASDLTKLSALREHLRTRVLASPLFDASRFANNLVHSLWSMWDRWMTANTE